MCWWCWWPTVTKCIESASKIKQQHSNVYLTLTHPHSLARTQFQTPVCLSAFSLADFRHFAASACATMSDVDSSSSSSTTPSAATVATAAGAAVEAAAKPSFVKQKTQETAATVSCCCCCCDVLQPTLVKPIRKISVPFISAAPSSSSSSSTNNEEQCNAASERTLLDLDRLFVDVNLTSCDVLAFLNYCHLWQQK